MVLIWLTMDDCANFSLHQTFPLYSIWNFILNCKHLPTHLTYCIFIIHGQLMRDTHIDNVHTDEGLLYEQLDPQHRCNHHLALS